MSDHDQRHLPRQPFSIWRRIVRMLARVACCYIAICLMLAFLQRKLIYVPTKSAVAMEDAGFTADQIEEVYLDVSAGVRLHGWYCRCPPDAERLSMPLVIILPGNAGNRLKRVGLMTAFHQLGCHTLIFDYRGYGGSGGSPAEELIARDSQRIWDFATHELGFSHDQIYLFGQSLGGGVATRLASEKSKEQTPPRGLILEATFTSLVDTAKFNYPWLPVNSLLVERYPSIERIKVVTCPILIVHGKQDRIVPFELGERLFAAAPESSTSGVSKRFVELPDAGHNDIAYVAADRLQFARLEFFDDVDRAVSP